MRGLMIDVTVFFYDIHSLTPMQITFKFVLLFFYVFKGHSKIPNDSSHNHVTAPLKESLNRIGCDDLSTFY